MIKFNKIITTIIAFIVILLTGCARLKVVSYITYIDEPKLCPMQLQPSILITRYNYIAVDKDITFFPSSTPSIPLRIATPMDIFLWK